MQTYGDALPTRDWATKRSIHEQNHSERNREGGNFSIISPLWVISGHSDKPARCPLYPQ